MIRLLVLIVCFISFTAHAQEVSDDDLLNEETPSASESSPAPAPAESAQSATSSAQPSAKKPVRKKMVRKKVRRTKKARARRVPSKSFFWYGSLGYDLGGDIKFSKVTVESTVVPGFNTSSKFSTDGAIEAAGGFFSMRRNSWGYGANLAYQLSRPTKFTVDGTNFGNGTLSTILLQGNGIYRMGSHLFFPFGLNFSLPSYSKGSSDVGSTKVKGDIGAQAGVGYIPGSKGLFYQGGLTMIGIQAQTNTTTETYTAKTAYLMAIGAKVGYLF